MKDKILSFISNYGLIVGGIFMIMISIIGLRNGYLDKQITERNETVKVKVIDCSETGNRHYFLKFEFKGKTFVKRTKSLYCEKISGKSEIEMLSNKKNDRFIFSDEYKTDNDYFFSSILGLMGIFIIYKGSKSKKN